MKALVLAGGSGTRLRPLSHSLPKQLIPIANRPVLRHVLDNIEALGITDIGVIVGDRGPEIAEAVGDGSRQGLRITYIPQEAPLGLAHCVLIARDFLGDDDFLMYLGDNMLPEGIAPIAAAFEADRPAAQVLVQKVAEPSAFGVAELSTASEVVRVVEKPEQPSSDLALVGVYFFTAAVHRAVAAIRPSGRGELEITDAVQWLVDQGEAVRASEYQGYWKDTGRVDDVLDCNRRLLGGLTPRIEGDVDAETVLEGPVVVEPGAQVARSRIRGPVIVGAEAVVEDSTLGPHTSIGRECRLSRAGIADSIALDGVHITGVGGLHGSVIGRSSVVGPPGAEAQHRLIVGDHSIVEVGA